ncbi:Cytohesin-2 [Hondaea fermentalgiana]|uniref:Cytohesin-2 n=1 Tax=Hondaea fermentalgiana TaxID=2315210 RepID=A0A2R5GTG1_9STRA|nr:Cytohesin-2 [Hondaea fermentalgiana]|eukprot:GBG34157.1 Cytohesin-2 [Hondaea fermentalgiana]
MPQQEEDGGGDDHGQQQQLKAAKAALGGAENSNANEGEGGKKKRKNKKKKKRSLRALLSPTSKAKQQQQEQEQQGGGGKEKEQKGAAGPRHEDKAPTDATVGEDREADQGGAGASPATPPASENQQPESAKSSPKSAASGGGAGSGSGSGDSKMQQYAQQEDTRLPVPSFADVADPNTDTDAADLPELKPLSPAVVDTDGARHVPETASPSFADVADPATPTHVAADDNNYNDADGTAAERAGGADASQQQQQQQQPSFADVADPETPTPGASATFAAAVGKSDEEEAASDDASQQPPSFADVVDPETPTSGASAALAAKTDEETTSDEGKAPTIADVADPHAHTVLPSDAPSFAAVADPTSPAKAIEVDSEVSSDQKEQEEDAPEAIPMSGRAQSPKEAESPTTRRVQFAKGPPAVVQDTENQSTAATATNKGPEKASLSTHDKGDDTSSPPIRFFGSGDDKRAEVVCHEFLVSSQSLGGSSAASSPSSASSSTQGEDEAMQQTAGRGKNASAGTSNGTQRSRTSAAKLTSSADTGASGVLKGWIHIADNAQGPWKKRWAVVHNNVLYMFPLKDSSRPSTIVILDEVSLEPDCPEDGSIFKLQTTAGRVLVLRAKSPASKDLWVSNLSSRGYEMQFAAAERELKLRQRNARRTDAHRRREVATRARVAATAVAEAPASIFWSSFVLVQVWMEFCMEILNVFLGRNNRAFS